MAKTEVRRKQVRGKRWILPYLATVASTSQASGTAGRMYMLEFEVTSPVVVDAVVYEVAGTSAGNVQAAIYGPTVTEDTAAGAALVASSASTAAGTINTPQVLTLTAAATLNPGRYYVGLEFSDVTTTFYRAASVTGGLLPGGAQTYDRGGGYGTPTDPCPAITIGTVFPGMFVRCQV